MSEAIYKLTIYEDDDSTVWTDVTNDPSGNRPYLMPLGPGVESEVDLLEGKSSIGQYNVEILDKRLTADDQDTGFFTDKLPTTAGESALIGHRALLEQYISAAWETVLDGIISDVRLRPDLVTYRLQIRDIRERERNIRIFTQSNTASVLPVGIFAGYGQFPGTTKYLIEPIEPATGTYYGDANSGVVLLDPEWAVVNFEWIDKLLALGRANPIYDDSGHYTDHFFTNLIVKWRPSAGGSWTDLEDMPSPYGAAANMFMTMTGYSGEFIYKFRVFKPTGVSLPTNAQAVDIVILHNRKPSEEYPLHIEDTFGQLLKDIYDGNYSDADPKIRYDTTRMAELVTNTPLARLLVTEVVEDGRKWIEENIYKPLGMAPAINADGEIYPISSELPDLNETLTDLTNAKIRVEGSDWQQSGRDAVTVVKVKYLRDYRPIGATGNSIESREVEHQIRSTAVALMGEKVLEMAPVTLRALGGSEGDPITGDVFDEVGAKLAQRRASETLDRYRYGSQRFIVVCRRSDVTTVGIGAWCIVSATWLPNYGTGERGANRLAQIIRVSDIDPSWKEFVLVDAGPHAQPIGQPTLGTPVANTDGTIDIPVNSLPSGGECRIDCAVNATEPAADSGLWIFMARVDQTGTVTTPPFPDSVKVWIRARGEAIGRRRSAWTTAVSVDIPTVARVKGVRVKIDPESQKATVRWAEANDTIQGVRITNDVHELDEDPTLGNAEDFDSTLKSAELSPDVPGGMMITVEVTPYPNFPISGTAGPAVQAEAMNGLIGEDDYPPPDAPTSVVLTATVQTMRVIE